MTNEAATQLEQYFGRTLELVVIIGQKPQKAHISAKDVVSILTVDELTFDTLGHRRADVLILTPTVLDILRPVTAQQLSQFVHEAGHIYLTAPQPIVETELARLGFAPVSVHGLYRRGDQASPTGYGQEYLDRWGETDFMKNWQLAGEQILAHLPVDQSVETVRVLDVGSLNGYIMEALRRHGVRQVFGVDISYELAVRNTVNPALLPSVVVGDFLQNSYPDSFSDLTICMEVLEHIPPEATDRFVEELKRVTTQRGRILISTSEDWTVDPTHTNCRPRAEWFHLFAKHGLIPVGRQVIFPGFNSFVLQKAPNQHQVSVYVFLSRFRLAVHRFIAAGWQSVGRIARRSVARTTPTVGTTNMSNRRAWVEQVLIELPAGWRVLDAGAGEQQYKPFCKHLNYVSQDFNQYDPKEVQAGLQMPSWDYGVIDIVGDITQIPEKDGAFDAILCTEVLEHIPDPIAALREFGRLLRPGGKLLLSAPFISATHFAPYHFCTGFNRYFYETHLPAFGFRIIKLEQNGNFFESLSQELQRLSQMAQTYTTRKLSLIDRLASQLLLRSLQRFSASDRGSGDFLCYGYHVVAEKIVMPSRN